ncbi:MAG: right-handed parallel beta-helix repeat-containing protein [Acidobacteria bacterium]|nr:right-handed parallel beta-helix repeat-containing protein [Acidobacteriota bacterium]
MKTLKTLTQLSTVLCLLGLLCTGKAQAEDISGTITVTKTIFEDSRLVGDVTCTMTDSPCIDFGASHISLWLNGFTISGPADPDNPSPGFCNATPGSAPASGIRILNKMDAQILGPGMVQRFRQHGIFIGGTIGVSTRAKVKLVTSHHNCFSGIFMVMVSDSVIEENVSVSNANNSGASPCGGNCITNSYHNIIRRNQFSGNGSVGPPSNNDFGVGLVGASGGNVIEDNSIGGNTNGILIQAGAVNNVIRRNIIAGNPPGQVSRTFGAAVGFDVKDESTVAGSGARNTIQQNWCVTYSGPGPAPCPNFPGPGPDDDD